MMEEIDLHVFFFQRYLKEELNGKVLNGYNIVGDGTPQAITPMLTGVLWNCFSYGNGNVILVKH